MKRFFKLLLITLLILIVAIVAAPFFVRQEQIQSFIENKVALPDNQKLKLEGNIKFGIFPYMHVNVPKASIIDKNGNIVGFTDFSFGFNISDLMSTGISFDSAFRFGDNDYEGNIFIKDYQKFLNEGQSPISLNLQKPLQVKVKGDLIHDDNLYSLKDFKITHKQTVATGNLKVITHADNVIQIDLNTEMDSEDIENIRRLVEFGKNQEDFNLLSGEGKVKLNITTKGITSADFKANLNGEGDVTVSDAAIYGIDLNEMIGSPQQTEMTKNTDRKIDIEEADSTFKISNGIVKIEELNANNQFANITGSGTVDIPASTVNVAIDIDADIASAKVNIPLLVYGGFDKIKFAPRAGDAMLGNIDNMKNIKDLSKIKFKDIKIKLNKDNLGESVNQLRDIGKSFGIDLDKATHGATKDMGTPASIAPVPATPMEPAEPASAAEPQQPSNLPASMKQQQIQQQPDQPQTQQLNSGQNQGQ